MNGQLLGKRRAETPYMGGFGGDGAGERRLVLQLVNSLLRQDDATAIYLRDKADRDWR